MKNKPADFVSQRFKLPDLALRRISAFLYSVFDPILIEPPGARFQREWQTYVKSDIEETVVRFV